MKLWILIFFNKINQIIFDFVLNFNDGFLILVVLVVWHKIWNCLLKGKFNFFVRLFGTSILFLFNLNWFNFKFLVNFIIYYKMIFFSWYNSLSYKYPYYSSIIHSNNYIFNDKNIYIITYYWLIKFWSSTLTNNSLRFTIDIAFFRRFYNPFSKLISLSKFSCFIYYSLIFF
jgi:hypothetical protein